MTAQWHYSLDGKTRLGPVSVEELRNGPSADFLRNTDQTEDLDYVLAHVDDVDAAAVFNGQQVSLLLPAAQPALAAEA